MIMRANFVYFAFLILFSISAVLTFVSSEETRWDPIDIDKKLSKKSWAYKQDPSLCEHPDEEKVDPKCNTRCMLKGYLRGVCLGGKCNCV